MQDYGRLNESFQSRISTPTPTAKSTKSIVDAELLKKIGAKLNLHSGKSISSRYVRSSVAILL